MSGISNILRFLCLNVYRLVTFQRTRQKFQVALVRLTVITIDYTLSSADLYPKLVFIYQCLQCLYGFATIVLYSGPPLSKGLSHKWDAADL